MKLISWNVNGIRACAGKGFLDYIHEEDADIVCIQETKALSSDVHESLLNPRGYFSVWHSAERKGYSGVALFTKQKPKAVFEGFGMSHYDCEGRVIRADYENFILFNVYFPNGQRDEERLDYKLSFYKDFFDYCNALKAEGHPLIICGDYNTAHKEIDLANPKENENYSGFLPVERAWIDRIIDYGYVVTFRVFNQEPGQYSWWTYRFGARRRNIGWRIDYFFVTQPLLPHVEDAFIRQDVMGSDHCPIGLIITV